ncbi:MAG: outer membrane protein [Xanthobacteraceae bacterium]|jgi:outer membrane immunogenic protein
MKKIAIAMMAGSGLMFAASGACTAADILPAEAPAYKAPVIVAPAFSWTGLYVGGNVGYGYSNVDPGLISFYQPVNVLAGQITGINAHPGGVIGGGQVGYNHQYDGFVAGLEADFSGTGMKDSVTDPVNNYSATTQFNWLATVRGRAGVAFDRTLLYMTGGLAVASVKTTLNDVYPSGTITTTSTPTYVGWTLGGGIELAFGSNWSARLEYLYLGLGSKQNTFNEPSPPGWPAITSTAGINGGIVRVGANYKFN